LPGLALASPAMMMKATSARCASVIAALKRELSFVPSTSRNVRKRHQPNAHLARECVCVWGGGGGVARRARRQARRQVCVCVCV
jgi:hypothetical protein